VRLELQQHGLLVDDVEGLPVEAERDELAVHLVKQHDVRRLDRLPDHLRVRARGRARARGSIT